MTKYVVPLNHNVVMTSLIILTAHCLHVKLIHVGLWPFWNNNKISVPELTGLSPEKIF